MPFPISTQNPGIVWDHVLTFPYPRYEDTHPQSPGFPLARYGWSVGQVIRENSYMYSYMSRVNNMAAANYSLRCDTGGPTYFQLTAVAVGRGIVGMDAMRLQLDIGTGFVLANGAEHSSDRRAYWLKWLMQSPDAAPDVRNGLIFQPANNGNNTQWVDTPVGANNSGGFGFTGDGAGQWQYASYDRTGVALLREAIALPAHNLAEWNQFELVILAERTGIPATVEIWFNQTLIGTRNWTGADLEPYAAQEWYYNPTMAGGSLAVGGGTTNFTDVVCRRGRYTRTGVEI